VATGEEKKDLIGVFSNQKKELDDLLSSFVSKLMPVSLDKLDQS
jgi:hypothetical protein